MRHLNKLFFVLFSILLINSVKAQTYPKGFPITTSTGWIRYGYLQADSGIIVASRDTGFQARFPGTMVYWQHVGVDSAYWGSNGRTTGKRWDKLGSGSSSGRDTVYVAAPLYVIHNTLTGRDSIAIYKATAIQDGYLSAADWILFNSKGTGTVSSVAALTLGTTGSDLNSSVAGGSTNAIITLNVPTASASNRGALSAADWTIFNAKQYAINFTTNGTTGAGTFDGVNLNIPNYTGGSPLGIIANTPFTGTSTPTGFTKVGSIFSQNNGLTVGAGGSGYYNNYLYYSGAGSGNYSASVNFKVTMEFTITTKPSESTERFAIERLSVNSTVKGSLVAAVTWVDATHITLNVYQVSGLSTETLIASTPPFTPASITSTIGAKYRIELAYNAPCMLATLARIDATKSPYQDVIESINVPFVFVGIFGTSIAFQPNTGIYALTQVGTSPTGVYLVSKFQVALYDIKGVDWSVIGNSISQGYKTTNPQNTWMQRLFNNSFLRYSLFAGQGDKTEEIIGRFVEVDSTHPKGVIVEAGANDIAQAVGSATFSANLTTIIRHFKAQWDTVIILRIPQTAFGYDTAFINVCNRENVRLLDMGGELNTHLDPAGIHPDDFGMQLIADKFKTSYPEFFGQPNANRIDRNTNNLYTNITSNYQDDYFTNSVFIDATSGNIQFNLTANESMVRRQITLVRKDATTNTVTVAVSGGGTINGGASLVLNFPLNSVITLVCTSATTWATQTGATSVPLSGITAATAVNSIDNLDKLQQWDWSTVSNGNAFKLNSASTAAASNGQILFNAQMSGANANSTQTTRTAYIGNLHSGTASTNIALQLDAQSGTTNIGLNVINGMSAFGNITPSAIVHIKAGTATAGTAPLKITAGTNLSTTEGGAIENDGTHLYYTAANAGARYQLDQQIPAGTGVVATTRLTGQTGAAALTTYNVPAADASYMVSANILVTTATLHNFTCTVTYTDEGNTSRTLTLNFSTIGGTLTTAIANATGTVPYEGVPLHIRCKASTTIVVATTGTFTTVIYNFENMINKLN